MHQVVLRGFLSIVIFLSTFLFLQTQVVVPAVAAVATCAEGGTCVVGDIGPGGGTIFYASSSNFNCGPLGYNLCQYLEVAPDTWSGGSADPTASWSDIGYQSSDITSIPNLSNAAGESKGIGKGYIYSKAQVAQGNSSSSAVGYARSYSGGGLNDWYLPTITELNQLCKWSHGNAWVSDETLCSGSTITKGGFSAARYWSSTEIGAASAWRQDFGDATQWAASKDLSLSVRPIRAFRGGASSCAMGGACVIGDIGPGGGFVFFVTGSQWTATGASCSTQCKYFEVAPPTWYGGSTDPLMRWSGNTSSSIPGALPEGLGKGASNTLAMIASNSQSGMAATASAAYRGGGKSDWFLPSIAELGQLSSFAAKEGGFSTGFYWSSSEYLATSARIQSLTGGGGGSETKSSALLVRPIRVFGQTSCALGTRSDGSNCEVGDLGPGGGTIFYASATSFLCGTYLSANCNYLEAAPNTWSGGTADSGQTWSGAISGAGTYRGNGYSDWYISHRIEIPNLYLAQYIVGGIQLSSYWTSEDTSLQVGEAWAFYMNTGWPIGNTKINSGAYGRPIRGFRIPPQSRTIVIDASSLLGSYSLVETPTALSATVSAGAGTKTFSSLTTSICTIHSTTGVIVLKAVGTCRLSVSIADDGTYAAVTNTYNFSVTKASPTVTLELSSGIRSLTYRTPTTITLFSATAGKISLKANGKAVSGCTNLAITTSRTCTFKSSSRGQVFLNVNFTPTNSSSYLAISTPVTSIPVLNRTARR
jgi:hypothetical protein